METADSDVTMRGEGGVRPTPSELVRRMQSHVANVQHMASGHIAVEISERVTERRRTATATATGAGGTLSRSAMAGHLAEALSSRHGELHVRLCQLAERLNAACAAKGHEYDDTGGSGTAPPQLWTADGAMPIIELAPLVLDYNDAKLLYADIGEHMAAGRLADADAATSEACALLDGIWTQLEKHERVGCPSPHDVEMATAIDDYEQGTAPAAGRRQTAAGGQRQHSGHADALAQAATGAGRATPQLDAKADTKHSGAKVQSAHYGRGPVGSKGAKGSGNAKQPAASRPKKPTGGCCNCTLM